MFGNLSCLSLTDSLNLNQSLGLFLNHPEAVPAELFDNSGCQGFSYSFNGSRSEVSHHAGLVIRLHPLRLLYLKLHPIKRMFHKISFQFQRFTGLNRMKASYANQFFPLCHQRYDRISVFFILVDNVIYISCDRIQENPPLICQYAKSCQTKRQSARRQSALFQQPLFVYSMHPQKIYPEKSFTGYSCASSARTWSEPVPTPGFP